LVTGGAGFIGSSLADSLLSQGERVRILDDFSTGRRSNIESLRGRLDVIEGSILDGELLSRALDGVEVVFHQAAIPSVARSIQNPQATMMVGVQGTTMVLEQAVKRRVRRLVFAASSSAYGNTKELPKVETMVPTPLSPYAVSKLACEHLVRVFAHIHGIETASLRYFNVFGPRQDPASEYAAVIPKFMTAALRGDKPVIFGDGEQTRDFCFIDNTVSANLLAASTPNKLSGEVVNIACGERTSLNTLLRLIGEEAVAAGDRSPGSEFVAEYRAPRLGDVRDSLADVRAAKALIGYEPKVSLREGLQRTYAAFRSFTKR
jgi:UDP-glucose 4-epimerase